MKIELHENSLRKLIRLLRHVADEVEAACDAEKAKNPSKQNNLRIVSEHDESVEELVKHYRKIHPNREKGIHSKHKSWKLLVKRLEQGYILKDLKKAVTENSKREWWVKHNRHSIWDIFGKNGNLDSFIQETKKEDNDAKRGYTFGSKSFTKGLKGFGD